MQIWGVKVAEGAKFKAICYNNQIVAYSRKLKDGREETLMKPLKNMNPIHIFSQPKVKSQSKLTTALKGLANLVKR